MWGATDGSKEHSGFVTDVLNEIDISEYNWIYTCEPEIMMVRMFGILHDASAHGR